MPTNLKRGQTKTAIPNPVLLAGSFAVDGSSAVESWTTAYRQFASVTKVAASTGLYKINLTQPYAGNVCTCIVIPRSATPSTYTVETNSIDLASATAPYIEVQVCKTADGAAVDPVTCAFDVLIVLDTGGL